MTENPAREKLLLPPHKPEFDGGTFTIEYLSTSPNGFEVVTYKSHRRRDQITPTTRAPIPLNQDQREQLKRAMAGQMRFAEGDKAREAQVKLSNTEGQERQVAMADFQQRRDVYYSRATGRVGLRNIRKQNNTLIVDIKPVDFPTYRLFSKTDASNELRDFSSISSTSMVLVTKDKRLIVQHRSPKNSLYGDIPGASVAGYLDGKPYYPSRTESKAEKRGKLQPIDTAFVKDNILREANEELGLNIEDFSNLRIVGLTHENTQIHDEFLLYATTSLTAAEMRQKAHTASINSKLSEQEFDEKFVDMPADFASITTLITEVKCPIPPSHMAGFIAAGYTMIIDEKGQEAADIWKNEMEQKVKQNYQEINQMVAKYYQDRPEELNNIPQGKTPRNPNGYEPAYLPHEQGLPDVMSELKRVGLITEE